jgi:hypothetical protein
VKLDHLEEGSPDCPLVRLCDFTAAEAERLQLAASALAAGHIGSIDIADLSAVESDDQCSLLLIVSPTNQEVVQVGRTAFECRLTRQRWAEVAELIEPFTRDPAAGRFQWLTGSWRVPGEGDDRPSLLLSVDGSW